MIMRWNEFKWNGLQWIGYGVVYLGLYFVHATTFGQERRTTGADEIASLVVIGLMGIGIVLGGMAIVRSAMRTGQEEADRHAEWTFRHGAVQPSDNFSLFLRPFDITGRLIVEKAPGGLFSWPQYDRPGADALERVLADAVRPTSPLVGLGGREEIEFGPGTAGTIPEWKKSIERAMKEATFIFIVPSANEGTLWEVGELKRGEHLHKTVFVMPPSIWPFKFLGSGEYRDRWEEARVACARQHQIELKPYKPDGALFMIDGRSVCCETGFRGFEPRDVAKSINRLVQS